MSYSLDDYTIYEGVWTNWSHGRVFGSTITLNRRDGGLLISFIALFITLVGTSFWRILCFALHHRLSSEAPRDALYHQQQAIFRNSANGGSGLWSLGRVLWAWRRYKTLRPFSRVLPTIILTIIFLCSFAVAGIFSSNIATSSGTEVLLSSPYCGNLNKTAMNDTELSSVYYPYITRQQVEAANYAQTCYSNTSSPEDCRIYVKKQLPMVSNRNASCPFSMEICKNDHNNLELDTGFIDSNDHLGVNNPLEDRVIFRSVFKCAPLATDGYQKSFSVGSNDMQAQVTRFYYGPLTVYHNEGGDYTLERWDLPKEHTANASGRGFAEDYSLQTRGGYSSNGSIVIQLSDFDPIQQLLSPRTDVFLVFLAANGIVFAKETDDPWYSAHRKETASFDSPWLDGDTVNLYKADNVASVLGCSQQSQLCNPSLPTGQQCSPLASALDTYDNAESLWPERGYRRHQVGELIYNLADFRPPLVPTQLGIASLTARNSLAGGVQAILPTNQWQLEVEHWFKAEQARIQNVMVEYATGPSDPTLRKYLTPGDGAAPDLCRNQKILTTAYTNFNTFGLCFTFALGGLIIVVSYALEPLLSRIQERWHRLDRYSRLEWCVNETLQLQRLAHEELGLGTWTGGADAVPLTEAGARLGMLDLEDMKHPRLKAPPAGLDEVFAEETDCRVNAQEEVKEQQERYDENTDSLPSPSSDSVSIEGNGRSVQKR